MCPETNRRPWTFNLRAAAGLLWLIACLSLSAPALAQDAALPEAEQASWDVFLRSGADDAALELVFINLLTGEARQASVTGERFSLLEDAVIYFDLAADQVMLAQPDASIQPHPFIRKSAAAERVDWVLSKDRRRIAWTEARRDDEGGWSTATYVSGTASTDETDSRELLLDGPRAGVRVLPVAFSALTDELILEAHADGITDYFAYRRYAALFALNLIDGETRPLPDEPACYCAAGFGESLLLRLPPLSDDRATALVYNLDGSGSMTIEGALPEGFKARGGALLSADDSLALYVLSQLPPSGDQAGEIRSLFVLADLQTAEQRLVSNPITGLARVLAWTDDNGAVLFTSDQLLGTWKLRLSDGKISELAPALYLGSLRG